MENDAPPPSLAANKPVKPSFAPLIFVMLLAVGIAAYIVSVILSGTETPDLSPFAQRVVPMPSAAENGPTDAVPATATPTK